MISMAVRFEALSKRKPLLAIGCNLTWLCNYTYCHDPDWKTCHTTSRVAYLFQYWTYTECMQARQGIPLAWCQYLPMPIGLYLCDQNKMSKNTYSIPTEMPWMMFLKLLYLLWLVWLWLIGKWSVKTSPSSSSHVLSTAGFSSPKSPAKNCHCNQHTQKTGT